MRVLIACEESQTVCKEFRRLGHEAYSCDIEPCSGGRPEWHYQKDVTSILNQQWDLIIAHPPCTFLTNSGVCWLTGKNAKPGRWVDLDEGARFFNMFLNHPCEKVAIENPIMHKYAIERVGRKHDCLVQPYQFGHTERKATCFWLKGLPHLKETNNVKSEMLMLPKREQQKIHYMPPRKGRAKLRSKTFKGIAEAMANQWGGDR
ncbi:DNA cytosine methyltransferase [Pseudoalteromonas marina]|uniref:DNA cytosine methyltransferase n=1 Tax=Pseudoalteromonas marina TaxID=267375 RepID=UPI003C512D30